MRMKAYWNYQPTGAVGCLVILLFAVVTLAAIGTAAVYFIGRL